jgi:hypothetical protein
MNEIIDIIEKIQKHRNPKYFLWQIIKDVEWFTSEKYKSWMIGKKDNNIYFNYNKITHSLYYSYDNIYVILETKYHLNEVKANELVGDMVNEDFKLRVNTTWNDVIKSVCEVSEDFKLRVNTSVSDRYILFRQVCEDFKMGVDINIL